MNNTELIKELRLLYNDIQQEHKKLRSKLPTMNKTSCLHDITVGELKGLTEAQRLINRRVRLIHQESKKEGETCYM